jgi:hypothetical protein
MPITQIAPPLTRDRGHTAVNPKRRAILLPLFRVAALVVSVGACSKLLGIADPMATADAGSNQPIDAASSVDGSPDAPSGTNEFASILVNPGDQGLTAVAADRDVYIGGSYSQAFSIGGMELPPNQQGEAFIAKVAHDGSVAWAQPLTSAGRVQVFDLVADSDGVDVLGIFATDGCSDSQALFHVGTSNLVLCSANIGTGWLFIARFNNDGEAQWADVLFDPDNPNTDDFTDNDWDFPGGPNPGARLAAGSGGDILVYTRTESSLQLDTGVDQATTMQIPAVTDVAGGTVTSSLFLVELSSAGTFVGATGIGCEDSNQAKLSAVASMIGVQSTIYVGVHCQTPVLPGFARANPQPNANSDFLLQYLETGVGTYVATVAAPVSTVALAVDPSGDAFDALAGSNFAIERRNATSLAATWQVTATKVTGTSASVGLSEDPSGNVVGGGPCTGFISLDSQSSDGDVTCAGTVVASLSGVDGHFRWARTFTATPVDAFSQDENFALRTTYDGAVLLGGTFSGSASLGSSAPVTTMDEDLGYALLAP